MKRIRVLMGGSYKFWSGFNYLSKWVRGVRGLFEMKTVVVQIGNSDNKLHQADWARFVRRVGEIIREHAKAIHFFGGPENWAEWQKVCWVFDGEESGLDHLKSQLTEARKEFLQESAAVTVGETEFV